MISIKTKPQSYVYHEKFGEGIFVGFESKNTAIVKFKKSVKYLNPKELQLIERIEYSSILDIDFQKLFAKCKANDEINPDFEPIIRETLNSDYIEEETEKNNLMDLLA